MKTIVNRKKAISAVFAAFLFASLTFAQASTSQVGGCHRNIPGLTDEQKSKIEELKVPHLQAITSYKAELEKLHAELRILEISENPDLNKINSNIDEISAVQNKIKKERAKHQMAIRALLTPEQKVAFDMHHSGGEKHGQRKHCWGDEGAKHCGEGHRGGKGDGQGPNCPNRIDNVN